MFCTCYVITFSPQNFPGCSWCNFQVSQLSAILNKDKNAPMQFADMFMWNIGYLCCSFHQVNLDWVCCTFRENVINCHQTQSFCWFYGHSSFEAWIFLSKAGNLDKSSAFSYFLPASRYLFNTGT